MLVSSFVYFLKMRIDIVNLHVSLNGSGSQTYQNSDSRNIGFSRDIALV